MSGFMKFLSFAFLMIMIAIGVERFAEFLKDAGDDVSELYQPPFVIEESLPGKCRYLYDEPGKHEEWADCMGVGYK